MIDNIALSLLQIQLTSSPVLSEVQLRLLQLRWTILHLLVPIVLLLLLLSKPVLIESKAILLRQLL